MKWYNMKPEEVEHKTNASLSDGLTDKNVKKRIGTFGLNKLKEAEKASALATFLAQFKDFMVLVLLAATLISGLIGEMLDAVTIMGIVFLNAILGFVQERKAEKSLDALKELSAPQMNVLRNREWVKVLSSDIVPGDYVKISAGDRVGADLRLMSVSGLRIDEASLTGESVPTHKHEHAIEHKDVSLGDQENMAFMGTMVTQGSGTGIVVATGMKTEMGKIAHLLQGTTNVVTPLQRRLEQLGKTLIAVALLLTALVVGIGVIQGHDVQTMFISGVSLAVAAIPEGLPAIVTVALALGVQRMIKRRGIVRKLPAVETLGCASVICSDKTGTLTQNKMTVKELWTASEYVTVTGNGFETEGQFKEQESIVVPNKKPNLSRLLTYGVLCNNAALVEKEVREKRKKKTTLVLDGDPTEGALLISALKAGYSQAGLEEQFKRIQEFPFDSGRKMMTVIVKDKQGQSFVITKGAPDVVLAHCERIRKGTLDELLTGATRQQVNDVVEGMASKALRTIAIAYRPLKVGETCRTTTEAESNLTLIGIQGMMDPPREEAKQAIQECREAGIKTIMITGDHKITAAAIAKELTILPEGGLVIDGKTLDTLSVEDLEDRVDDIYVYARVSPEHKLKIVQALQKRDHIVAMTGDGVNDAPAIKAANIGIAMGITGTDVAKEASELVLADDNS